MERRPSRCGRPGVAAELHLDLANARVEFNNGAVAMATASRVSRERIRRLRLFQPNGYLSLDLASGAGEFMRVRGDWQPGTGQALSDVVERIELAAPEADALRLELRSFVHAVQGEREVVVSGEEGGPLSPWPCGWRTRSANRRSPCPLPDDRAAGPPHLRLRRRALGRFHGAGVVQALRDRYPDATIEALGGPRMAAAGAVVRYPMEGLAALAWWKS